MKRANLIGVIGAWIVIYAIFSFLSPNSFLRVDNIELMMRQSIIVGLGAIGMCYIILSGGIDLSAGSVVALSTVVAATVMKSTTNPIFALLAAIGTGTACGFMNGTLTAKLRTGPFIVTLATMLVFRGLATGLAHETTVSGVPDSWLRIFTMSLPADQKWLLLPKGGWLWLVFLALAALALKYTAFGRNVVAIGSNENTAKLCGIPVDRVKIAVYTMAGAFVGLAGVMDFSRTTIGDPTAATGKELEMIAAVVIGGGSLSGGEGSVVGAAFGALIMTTINMGCTRIGVPNWVQQILTGLIIVSAVAIDKWRLSRQAAR